MPRYLDGDLPVIGSASLTAWVPASRYRPQLRNPNGRRYCSASATRPATSGAARLVPPIDCSTYPVTTPLRLKLSSPTPMPVDGSASALMSGSARTSPARLPGALASEFGTTPRWYPGCAQSRLWPPPLAYASPCGTHLFLTSNDRPVDQPVSNSRGSFRPMPSVLPPTAVAYGSLDGVSTPEPSPAENSMLTPSAAARSRYACSMLTRLRGCDSTLPSHELDAIRASG